MVGIGELLWDLLPGGERLGGAPFNVVAHLRRFGNAAWCVSAVGNDVLGRRALEEARRLGVDATLIEGNELPTGVVRVQLDETGVPDYEIVSPAAYEAVRGPVGPIADIGGSVDLIAFGTLAQRFPGVRGATRRLAADAPNAVRLYDVNLRRDCWTPDLVDDLLRLATVAKLNRKEEKFLASELGLPAGSTETFAKAISERYALRAVCVTRGRDGAALLLDGAFAEFPSPSVRVVDTVGAGDAFAAALGHGMLAGWEAEEILPVANRLGAFVASRSGAVPEWDPSEI